MHTHHHSPPALSSFCFLQSDFTVYHHHLPTLSPLCLRLFCVSHSVQSPLLFIVNVLLLVAGKYPREIMNSITNLCVQYTVGLVSSISGGWRDAAVSGSSDDGEVDGPQDWTCLRIHRYISSLKEHFSLS